MLILKSTQTIPKMRFLFVSGHYIVLYGYDLPKGVIFYRNPTFRDRKCSWSTCMTSSLMAISVRCLPSSLYFLGINWQLGLVTAGVGLRRWNLVFPGRVLLSIDKWKIQCMERPWLRVFVFFYDLLLSSRTTWDFVVHFNWFLVALHLNYWDVP